MVRKAVVWASMLLLVGAGLAGSSADLGAAPPSGAQPSGAQPSGAPPSGAQPPGKSPKPRAANRALDLYLGLSVGYGHHISKTTELDAASGASPVVDDRAINDPGVALGAVADLAVFRAGPGDVGLQLTFQATLPGPYFDFGFVPRYRFRFPVRSRVLRSVEPWIGTGLALGFIDRIDSQVYLLWGVSLGCELNLGARNLYLGFVADIWPVNLVGTQHSVTVGGTEHRYQQRYDSFLFRVVLSYRVF